MKRTVIVSANNISSALNELKSNISALTSVMTRVNVLLGEASLVKFNNTFISADSIEDPSSVLINSVDVILADAEKVKTYFENVRMSVGKIKTPPNPIGFGDLVTLVDGVRVLVPTVSGWVSKADALLSGKESLLRRTTLKKIELIAGACWVAIRGINTNLNNLGLLRNSNHPNAPVVPLSDR